MALGRKTGGRKLGTPNKINAETAAQLAELGCNPVEGLAKIALNELNPVGIRLRAFDILMEYTKPKLSRVDFRGPDGTPLFSVEAIRAYMASRPGAGAVQ